MVRFTTFLSTEFFIRSKLYFFNPCSNIYIPNDSKNISFFLDFIVSCRIVNDAIRNSISSTLARTFISYSQIIGDSKNINFVLDFIVSCKIVNLRFTLLLFFLPNFSHVQNSISSTFVQAFISPTILKILVSSSIL